MYLKKLELSGFKSFANKTTLNFLDTCDFLHEKKKKNRCGITAIVGPNGSGKSNVADAIRWALGEQSMKNLRGKKTEDVIFAGSGKKARLGFAGVTLYFDNSDRKIPLDFSEVSVSRKFFRSGESEYFINGSRARLIDIIDLLAKAGVGKESYCVISQGMSDAVLSASPTERRSIIEDAAGVKQFQIKKERALRKLERTKENLERSRDLAREIEPHLKSLKRQAEKAQKGKKIAEKLKNNQIMLFSFLWHNFEKEKRNRLEEKDELGRTMMNIQREVDKLGDILSREAKEVQDSGRQKKLEEKKDIARQEINRLEKELVVAEGKIEILKEKLNAYRTIKNIPVDLNYVRQGIQKVYERQEKLIKRLNGIESLDEIQDIKEFARAVGQDLYDLGRDVAKGVVNAPKNQSEIKKEKETLKEIEDYEKKRKDDTEKLGEVKKEVEALEEKIKKEIKRDQEIRRRFFDLEKTFHQKQNSLNEWKDKFNEAKISLAKTEVREDDLVNEVKDELRMNIKELEFNGETMDVETIRKEIARLKIQKEQIGGIDPMVVAEYQETNERFDFLSAESDDLEKALDSLLKIIREMDKKIDKSFQEAFEKINDEFQKYFRIIFGGGKAKLIKTLKQRNIKTKKEEDREENNMESGDEENVQQKTEIGVEISACPPGKKIANLSMLSGGERSLTSIALLFAVISFNPPPFAVLDEIEAALDEANSRRFSKILQELSGNTQFIAITHNRETMRQAALLYGVTMGDDGISKLLSVRLDQVGKEGKIATK